MNKQSTTERAKRVITYLVISVFLGGGCVALATMEPNPFNWSGPLRPLSLLITFLFFQWLYTEKNEKSQDATHKARGAKEERH
jgi:hypothetical protein